MFHVVISYCRHRNGEHQFTKNRFWVNQNGTGAATTATEFINGNSNKQQKGKQPGESLRKPIWDVTTLMPFQKNFYVPHQNIVSRCVLKCSIFVTIR